MLKTTTRREFLRQTTCVATVIAGSTACGLAAAELGGQPRTSLSWYRRTLRWGQTNIAEIDPERYDIPWWRSYWKRTNTQGVVVNAGGIVAYYPTRVPLHRRAEYLKGRDLFGELSRAAHQDGLAVFARMDSSKAHEDFYRAHPDWFAVDAARQPHKSGEFYVACVNSPYYEEHITAILREVIELYHPEGFTDNSWSGVGRGSPCFCENCEQKFREHTGAPIPRERNWSDPIYRKWIQWNYARRLELWDLNNRVTRTAGGADCIWVGMNGGSISGQAQSFRDYREICRRAEMLMLDHQSRSDASGFQNNGETGKLVHGLLGWDKLIPESMAMYQAGRPTFRLTSKPAAEARMWMVEGLAGGLQPWWHHLNAYHEDRRMYHTAEPLYRWHKTNEQYLFNRRPVATVGVVWSQRNTDFYGRDDADLLVELPWRGMTQALVRARIPYLPVHADDLERDAAQFSLLVLPNLAAMSDGQVQAVRRFVERGSGLLATGQTSLFDEWGDARPDFALGGLFGAHIDQTPRSQNETTRRRWAAETAHSYLRLVPELRAGVDGPHPAGEPPVSGKRHAVLKGFEETDILSFGGVLEPLRLDQGTQVLMTHVPPFPVFPPESSWMREPKTDVPGLVLNTTAGGSRIGFLPADLDRRFGRDNLPDHGDLLTNLVRWACKEEVPLLVEGPGLVDAHLYYQTNRFVLHLVNLTSAGTWRQPVDELIPIGPLRVKVKLPEGAQGKNLRLLVADRMLSAAASKGWTTFEISSLLAHEVVVSM
jgi:hypothetical protein